jgi:hypothetical protein
MVLSLEHTVAFFVGSIIFSAGGAWFIVKNTAQKADTANRKADAVGKKIDDMRNELIEMRTAIDKDLNSLKREIEIVNESHVTSKDIERFVTKKECQARFSGVVQKSELDLILEKLDLRFTHLEQDNKEIKKDIKDILKILKERI